MFETFKPYSAMYIGEAAVAISTEKGSFVENGVGNKESILHIFKKMTEI